MDIQTLLGESYVEGMTIEQINSALAGKKIADLSTGKYVDKDKYENELKSAQAKIVEKEQALKSKMTNDELTAKEKEDLIKEIETLKSEKAQNAKSANRDKAIATLSETKTMLGLTDEDKELSTFLDNIVGENSDTVKSVSSYVNKLVKEAFEKGKKTTTRTDMGSMGKTKTTATGDGVESLGKRLASNAVSQEKTKDYFARN